VTDSAEIAAGSRTSRPALRPFMCSAHVDVGQDGTVASGGMAHASSWGAIGRSQGDRMLYPLDLSVMLDRLERSRQAAAAPGWCHQHLRELAWAIQAFGERSFLEQRRDFGSAAFGQRRLGAAADESRFGWWYAAAPFLDDHPELRKFSREDVVSCAAQIDATVADPFADVIAEDESRLSEFERRMRMLRRAGPSILRHALLSIAEDVLRVARCLPAASSTYSIVGSA